MEWTNAALDVRDFHPLLVIGIFIVSFLAIHPFQDGNGRLSRILTTLLLLRCGWYVYTPYSSLESVIENSKEGYYLALRQTQTSIRTDSPDWHPGCFFPSGSASADEAPLERKDGAGAYCHGCSAGTFSENFWTMPREHGRVTLKDMVVLTGVSRNYSERAFPQSW